MVVLSVPQALLQLRVLGSQVSLDLGELCHLLLEGCVLDIELHDFFCQRCGLVSGEQGFVGGRQLRVLGNHEFSVLLLHGHLGGSEICAQRSLPGGGNGSELRLLGSQRGCLLSTS